MAVHSLPLFISLQKYSSSQANMSIIRFLKNWTLPVAICVGFLTYEIYSHLSLFDPTRVYAPRIVAIVQPVLIFTMLFLSFCKIDARQLRPRFKHLGLLSIQAGSFIAGALLLHIWPALPGGAVLQGCMLCMICPTATSACVVTTKLGGDAADITTYTVLVNLLVAVVVPAFVPLFHDMHGQTFAASFLLILGRVFPMLICPFIAAQCCRIFLPKFTSRLIAVPNLPFYLWAVALSIAIAVTTRSIAHSQESLATLTGIALGSLACCIVQFAVGTWIGKHHHSRISTAQSLGQKNTVFAIWVGYTFLNPVTSIAGGFYSVWHNLYNTWQLRQMRKTTQQ